MTHTLPMKHFGLVAGVLLVGICSAAALASGPVFTDQFNDSSLNSYWWSPLTSGGPTIQEANSRLEVTVPASCTDPFFYAHVQLTQPLVGDFDAQVDYQVLNWPAANGVRIGMVGVSSGVERVSRSASETSTEAYCTDIGGAVSYLTASESTGTLRLVRTGDVISGYYLHDASWVLIGSGAYSDDDAYLALSGWSQNNDFSHQDVTFAFDNFQVNSGSITPEPATLAMLMLGGLAVIRRKRNA